MRWACLAILAVGCGAFGGADPCGGARPALAECESGLVWSDCGGSGADPRFACHGSDCRWFANGCVAEGFEASSCPASDLCCHAGSPYEGAPTGSERDLGVSSTTLGWGVEPWDAARERNLSVVVGPTSSATRPALTCAEASSLLEGSACQVAPSEIHAGFLQQEGVTIAYVGRGPGYGGHTIMVEITHDQAGTPRARVCSVPFQDASRGICEAGEQPRGCATSGSVTIEALVFDATTQLDLSATFADGSTIELRI
jgi:hypothetical protein